MLQVEEKSVARVWVKKGSGKFTLMEKIWCNILKGLLTK